MIADLKPYDENKDSEQVWLGNVPTHWNVLSNRGVFSEVKERGHSDAEMLSVTINRGIIRQADLLSGTSKKDSSNADKSKYKLVRPNDLAYNKMRAWQGALGISAVQGIISPAYVVMRPHVECDPKYFHFLFRTPAFAKEAERWSYGITSDMWSLRPEHFKMIYAILPPPDEQALIVRFLDWASVRLGKAIAAKRKVIGLLEEQKQAIIHRAVTRGLDENVPLKPSGLDWLGDVPDYADIVPLKAVCKIQSGVTLGKRYANEQMTEFAYLRVANVQAGRLELAKVHTLKLPKRDAERSLLQYGDLLMTEGGDPDKLGRGCIWRNEIEPCIHQNHLFAVRPDLRSVVPDYLEVFLASQYARNYFIRTAKQTTNLASTNRTTIGAFRLVLPKCDMQQSIVDGIRRELAPIHGSIERFEKEISLLREYQTRLISDVVTGKLDVREVARSLPADVSEEAAELQRLEGAATESADEDFATDDDLVEEAV